MGVYRSARQAAAYCGVNEKTVRRWIASGRLSAVQEDGAFRIAAADLEPLAAGRRTSATVIVDRDAAAPRPTADTGAVTAAAPPPHEAAHLAELVKQLHRENVELAGRCGFLQARVQDLEREIRLLREPSATFVANGEQSSDPAPAPTSQTSQQSGPEQNGQDSGAQQPPRRPWWKFWV